MLRLCEIVADVLPLGSNEWAVVAAQYEEERSDEEPFRDQDSLRKKFDKLAAHKKNTGDPSCPEEVRCAKRVARDIVGRASAGEVDESSSEDEAGEAGMNGESTESSIGITARKRAEGARGVKRKRNGEDVLIEHVAEMSSAITQLVNGMTQPAPAPVNREEIN